VPADAARIVPVPSIELKGTERSERPRCHHVPSEPAEENNMPGIDFDRLRRDITMEEVLQLLGFEPSQRTGDQWHGACPLHGSTSGRARHFSVNVAKRRYCCHKCPSQGW